jgi:hypothetical protein
MRFQVVMLTHGPDATTRIVEVEAASLTVVANENDGKPEWLEFQDENDDLLHVFPWGLFAYVVKKP